MSTCPPQGSHGPEFLTVKEAAKLLRVNRKTLYEAIRLGQVPDIVRLGRVLRIRRSALVEWQPGNSGPALGENR
ncbi:helix-turn-helix domain-containing protein [Myxococcus llanfairpwllgwyngyllgogerychwyrndrobwllllantysiliogogogochensis]|uniref:Helix-turn-helix domain-containing protein n=1 Tax=Myxococcus llanfairpwllgwyngyllgogerychwyrndrobwllllantysiliogogogochensis TaxID=2590453 RepID=A0A540WI13_9BACT|nr:MULTISPECIES: helix-turn-helix domain-containing protein [Myxococcus]NTX35402.1 helix-turn-helix domain-containing protein [Myxococcus sp. CA033]TQF08537.1 helix-turn-helix domain-containing protein [Myxococcus llanfairpwllgwyngyllgogerychwyrndrobwllllantysiliogogogochensis]